MSSSRKTQTNAKVRVANNFSEILGTFVENFNAMYTLIKSEFGGNEVVQLTQHTLVKLVESAQNVIAILTTNSSNSSLPPGLDPNRAKPKKGEETSEGEKKTSSDGAAESAEAEGDPSPEKKPQEEASDKGEEKSSPKKKKPGGQPGHKGHHLERKTPTNTVELKATPPSEGNWVQAGTVVRQVIEVTVKTEVTDYVAQVLVNTETGEKITAEFPAGVTAPVQYGIGVKALIVNLSVYQFIPYKRLSEFFKTICGISVSQGTIANVLRRAAKILEDFDYINWVKTKILMSDVVGTDDTGINIEGKNCSVISFVTELYTYLKATQGKSREDYESTGIIQNFSGVLVSDAAQVFEKYENCYHALCNLHLIRNLKKVVDIEDAKWADNMIKLIKEMIAKKNEYINEGKGEIPEDIVKNYIKRVKNILTRGESEAEDIKEKLSVVQREKSIKEILSESDKPDTKDSLSQVLLKRIRSNLDSYTLFLYNEDVPSNNTMTERSFRMLKIHQKISGTFKSLKTADIFCELRGFVDTCMKNGVSANEGITNLLKGKLPSFIDISESNPLLFCNK